MANAFGQWGIWRSGREVTTEQAVAAESLGFGSFWLGSGSLDIARDLLDATTSIVVATGIANIWSNTPEDLASAYHRLNDAHPGRFVLGFGAGHREAHGAVAVHPYDEVVRFLDVFDDAGVPVADRALAALGPRMLQLAADRTGASHPYLTTPEHTRIARELVGPGPVIVPEQKVILDTDPERARALARTKVPNPYFNLVNYTNNLRRLGFDDADFADGGSDRIVDALALHGTDAEVAAGLRAHLDAGADHVAIQLVTWPEDDPIAGFGRLAAAVL